LRNIGFTDATTTITQSPNYHKANHEATVTAYGDPEISSM